MSFSRPTLCRFLASPIRWIPQLAHSAGLALMLNQVLRDLRQGGDMDFLCGKVVQVVIADVDVTYCMFFDQDGRFKPRDQNTDAQVRIVGDLQTFLLLATRREDADSLFFRRLLRMEGETATGLHLKNFLDALGDPPLPPAMRLALDRLTDLYTMHCAGAQAGLDFGASGVQHSRYAFSD